MSYWLQAARIRHLQLVKVLKKAGLDDEEAAMKLEAATALFHERCGGNLPKPGQLTNLGDAEQALASQNDARRSGYDTRFGNNGIYHGRISFGLLTPPHLSLATRGEGWAAFCFYGLLWAPPFRHSLICAIR